MFLRPASTVAVATLVLTTRGVAAEPAAKRLAPLAETAPAPRGRIETATFAGGCFWGVEGVCAHVAGVTRAVAGYTGGARTTADYEDVSTGRTGHAEAVRVTFDPKVVSYAELLRIFFSVVLDPTEIDRQGPDTGSQYRSVLFGETPAQAVEAHAYIAQLNAAHSFGRPIATRVARLADFYVAEDHHQDFMVRHPVDPYILAWDASEVTALQALFPERWRAAAIHGA